MTQRRPEINDPASGDLYQTGTVALVLDIAQLPNGSVKVMMKGIARAQLEALHPDDDPASASFTVLAEIRHAGGADMDVLRKAMLARFEQYARHSGLEAKLVQAGVSPLAGILAAFNRMDPGTLADTLAAQTPLPLAEKQQVLEILDCRERFEYVDALTQELDSTG